MLRNKDIKNIKENQKALIKLKFFNLHSCFSIVNYQVISLYKSIFFQDNFIR